MGEAGGRSSPFPLCLRTFWSLNFGVGWRRDSVRGGAKGLARPSLPLKPFCRPPPHPPSAPLSPLGCASSRHFVPEGEKPNAGGVCGGRWCPPTRLRAEAREDEPCGEGDGEAHGGSLLAGSAGALLTLPQGPVRDPWGAKIGWGSWGSVASCCLGRSCFYAPPPRLL